MTSIILKDMETEKNMNSAGIGKLIKKLLILLAILASAFFIFRQYYRIVYLGTNIFLAERAVSFADQERGLGERASLCQKCAMIFEFREEGDYVFWMKGMYFNLDIIWVSGGRIAYFAKNVPYDSMQKINPKIKADKVLEINAGLSDKYGLKVGDEIFTF